MYEKGEDRVVLLQHAQIVDVYTRTAGLTDDELKESRDWAMRVMLTASADGLNDQVLAVVEDIAERDVVMAFGLSLAIAKQAMGERRPEDFLTFAKVLINEDKARSPEDRVFTEHDEFMVVEISMEFAESREITQELEVVQSQLSDAEADNLLKRAKGLESRDVVALFADQRHPLLDYYHDKAIREAAMSLTARDAVRWLASHQAHTEEGQQEIDALHDGFIQQHARSVSISILEAVRWLEKAQPRTAEGAELIALLHDNKAREYVDSCTPKNAVSFLASVQAMTEAGQAAIDELHDRNIIEHAQGASAVEAVHWLSIHEPRTYEGKKAADALYDQKLIETAEGMAKQEAILWIATKRARTTDGQHNIDELKAQLRRRL